ncbi:hypothetical protein FWG95_02210 [Candidatus Saccharibacteria bacterium]|nr:hypothetical protein [Candidatus Saccharibacteria bacterium]
MINANLNYNALEKDARFDINDFTPQQIETAGLEKTGRQMKIFRVILYFFGGFTAFGFLMNLVGLFERGGDSGWSFSQIFMQTIWLVLIILFIVKAPRWFLRTKLRLLKFAQDNGLKYDARVRKPTEDLMIFKLGHSQKISDIISWPNQENHLGRFTYTVGHGKNQQTYTYSYVAIKLPRRLPHLFINSKKNMINPQISGYKVEKLKLEGDFPKTFVVYAPPQYRVDALQVLAPNVMASLLDHGWQYDYEIIDDWLYIFSGSYSFNSKKTMQSLLESAARLAPEISHQAKNYKDAATQTFSENVIAESGARIEKKKWSRQMWIMVIVVTLSILYMIFNLFWGFSQIDL